MLFFLPDPNLVLRFHSLPVTFCVVVARLWAEKSSVFFHNIYVHSCMTGRAIWGNIQLVGDSVDLSAARDNTEPES